MNRLIVLFLINLSILLMSCSGDKFESGKKSFEEKKYHDALVDLRKVGASDSNYKDAQSMLKTIDSIMIAAEAARIIEDSISAERVKVLRDSIRKEEEKANAEKEIKRLSKELESIKTFTNGAKTKTKVDELVLEVALFMAWAQTAAEAKESSVPKIKKLGKDIEKNLKRLQAKEFPKIRSQYAAIIDQLLWEQNIDVTAKGSSRSTIEFVGGTFASNKNIGEMQKTVSQNLKDFRFKKSQYKWYDGASKYDYYDLKPKKDTDLK